MEMPSARKPHPASPPGRFPSALRRPPTRARRFCADRANARSYRHDARGRLQSASGPGGSANYQTHAGADTPPGLVIDNSDAGFSVSGDWPASSAVAGYQGANYQTHAADAEPVGSLVIDNPQGSASGSWSASSAVAGYIGSNYLTHPAGSGSDRYTWTASLSPGSYRVYARWSAHANRASDARYTISHAAGQDSVSVSQQINGGSWNLLGSYPFGTAGTVSLAGAGNGYLIADAVKFVPVGGSPPSATWTASLSPGSHRVYARWSAHANRASDARYTISHAGGQDSVSVSQQLNGGSWNLLGRYSFGAAGSISLSSAADGYVIADAVRFVADDAAYDSATWRPASSGTYDLYARWSAHPNRASDARYTVSHAGGQDSLTVNQRQSGGSWNRLGSYTLAPHHAITLSSQANGYVIADALRLLRSTSGQPAALHYVHSDHLGTPRAVVTQAAAVLWRWDGEAFGNSMANEDADNDGQSLAYNLRFPGQYFDRETNLHYNGARDYDPSTGRYPTADPLGLAGGDLSLYLYAKNNPLSYIDPRGESTALGIALGIGVGVYAIGVANGWWNSPTIPGKPSDDPFGSGGTITPFSPSGNGSGGSGSSSGSENCPVPDDGDDCKKQWQRARIWCATNFGDPKYDPQVFGSTMEQCVRGQVSERCGGNRVSQPPPPPGAKGGKRYL